MCIRDSHGYMRGGYKPVERLKDYELNYKNVSVFIVTTNFTTVYKFVFFTNEWIQITVFNFVFFTVNNNLCLWIAAPFEVAIVVAILKKN